MVGSLALWRAVHTVRQISDTEVERSTVAFYVEQDSAYESLEALKGNELGILAELDRSSTDETLQQTESEYGMSFATREYASLSQLAEMPCGKGKWLAILLNQAFLSLYEETPWVRGIPGGTA